jgi:hypothetical protein
MRVAFAVVVMFFAFTLSGCENSFKATTTVTCEGGKPLTEIRVIPQDDPDAAYIGWKAGLMETDSPPSHTFKLAFTADQTVKLIVSCSQAVVPGGPREVPTHTTKFFAPKEGKSFSCPLRPESEGKPELTLCS